MLKKFNQLPVTWTGVVEQQLGENLPVRPLAPRRKTPGQLYPMFNDLPGWAKKH